MKRLLVALMALLLLGVMATPSWASTPAIPGEPTDSTFLIKDAIPHINTLWSQAPLNNPYPGQPRGGIFYYHPAGSPNYNTACGATTSLPSNAFFCPNGVDIYFDTTWTDALIQRFASDAGTGDYGDGAVLYVLAHEWGHYVQSIQKWPYDEIAKHKAAPGGTAKPLELGADCLAGIGIKYLEKIRYTDIKDAAEAFKATLALGDFDYTNVNHHGTPAERFHAIRRGYFDYSLQTCHNVFDEAVASEGGPPSK